MKKELTWWIAFALVAIFVAGQMSDFRFSTVDIQLHDTYYVLPAYFAVLFIFIFLGLLRGLVYLTEILTERSRVFAWIVIVLNGSLSLFWIFLIYNSTITYLDLRQWYPELPASNYLATLMVMLAALVLMIVVEFRTIRKLKLRQAGNA
jgi:heme/copper-type cytochrome/quinol oxidase subunit 1